MKNIEINLYSFYNYNPELIGKFFAHTDIVLSNLRRLTTNGRLL